MVRTLTTWLLIALLALGVSGPCVLAFDFAPEFTLECPLTDSGAVFTQTFDPPAAPPAESPRSPRPPPQSL